MATHKRYAEIDNRAQSTGRRSIQLWMAKDTVPVLDWPCREHGVRRAELLDPLINEASGEPNRGSKTERAQSVRT